jgi:hypothetical protein
MPGSIYCLSNESMPGLLKIGRTDRSVKERAAELRTSGVPTPFVVELVFPVEDSVKSEKLVHSLLNKYREDKSREFFRTSIHTVQLAFDKVTENESYDDGDGDDDGDDDADEESDSKPDYSTGGVYSLKSKSHCEMCSKVYKGKVYALYGAIGRYYAGDATYIPCPGCQDF